MLHGNGGALLPSTIGHYCTAPDNLQLWGQGRALCAETAPYQLGDGQQLTTARNGDDGQPVQPLDQLGHCAAASTARSGVSVYVPTEGLTAEQVLLLEAEVLRAAAVQSMRNSRLRDNLDFVDGLPGWGPQPDMLGAGSLAQRFNSAPPQPAPFRPEHQQRRRGRRGGQKQHQYRNNAASLMSSPSLSAPPLKTPLHLPRAPQWADLHASGAGMVTGGTGVFLPACQPPPPPPVGNRTSMQPMQASMSAGTPTDAQGMFSTQTSLASNGTASTHVSPLGTPLSTPRAAQAAAALQETLYAASSDEATFRGAFPEAALGREAPCLFTSAAPPGPADHLITANALAGMLQQWAYPVALPMSSGLSNGLLRSESSGLCQSQGFTSFMDNR